MPARPTAMEKRAVASYTPKLEAVLLRKKSMYQALIFLHLQCHITYDSGTKSEIKFYLWYRDDQNRIRNHSCLIQRNPFPESDVGKCPWLQRRTRASAHIW